MSELVHVKGLSELQAFLDALPAKMEQNVMRGAMRAGAMPIRDEARRTAPIAAPSTRNRKEYNAYLGALRDSIRVSVKARGGRVTASVKAGGKAKGGVVVYWAGWAEYGTRPHFISVRDEAKPGRKTRNGWRGLSIRTLNRMAARGSLRIGQNFVGASVTHPGARPRPYMRPALDRQATNAVLRAGEYIKSRLSTKHGLDTSEIIIEAEE